MFHFKRAHILKENKGAEFPKRILFFDTETYETAIDDNETELNLKLGSCSIWNTNRDEREGIDFKERKQFWDFVFGKCYKETKLYCVAHNLAFDFRVLKGFAEMKERGFVRHKIITAGLRNIWEFRKDRKTICFLDNMNFFSFPLEYLGENIGLKKLTMPKDNDEQLLIYCRRDVEIMITAWKMLFGFLKENDLGCFAKTIASQAFNAFRHRFMKDKIFIHKSRQAAEAEQASYFGGRTECFALGKQPKRKYYLLDVNSMYPSVMSEYEYPVKYIGKVILPSDKFVKELLYKYALIAETTINIDEPIFAFRHEEKTIFPVGTFTAFLTTRELDYAIKKDFVRKIYKCFVYEKKNIFASYVGFFYKKKLEYKKQNNQAFVFLTKLFLNSVYGKFGQRNERWKKANNCILKEDGITEYIYADNESFMMERFINGVCEKSTGEKIDGFDNFTAIPAHITADARLKLWSIIKQAGRENVFYCDTDSIITNTAGYKNCKNITDENKLGSLSVKDKTERLIIYGAKDYIFGKHEIIKGIKRNAEKIGEGKYRQDRFEGFQGALRNGRLNRMIITSGEKTLARKYDKADSMMHPIELYL